MGFQYLLLVRVKQCIDLPVHALRPLESQRLGGLLGLFLRRETTGEEPQPRRLFLKILYPSSIPEQTSRYNDTHTYYDRERRHRNPLTRAPRCKQVTPLPSLTSPGRVPTCQSRRYFPTISGCHTELVPPPQFLQVSHSPGPLIASKCHTLLVPISHRCPTSSVPSHQGSTYSLSR